MDVTAQRRTLTTLAAGLLLGAVGAIGWSISGIDSSEDQIAASPQVTKPIISADGDADASDAALNLALRRPLVDPPPPAPKPVQPRPPVPAPPPAPGLQLTLVGTIIESENSLAIIADASGAFDVKGVGESLELSPPGVSVKRIESEQVELQFGGKTSTVSLDRERPKGGGGKRVGKEAKARRRDR